MNLDYLNPDADGAMDPQWERFSDVINTIKDPNWVNRLFSALELGQVVARSTEPPPHTKNDVHDSAGTISSEWWLEYKKFGEIAGTRDIWITWLYSHVDVNSEQIKPIMIDYLESLRRTFKFNRRPHILRTTWSDLEVLAWCATADMDLVKRMRDFSHQARNEHVAHTVGTLYLRLNVALSYCSCGATRTLSLPNEAGACSCILSAADQLIISLLSGNLTATLVSEKALPKQVDAGAFTNAILDFEQGRFELLGEPAELQFQEPQICAAITHPGNRTEHPTAPVPSTEAKAKVGRPLGSGKDDGAHLQEMYELLDSGKAKTIREAAVMVAPDANTDKSASLESVTRRLDRKYRNRQKCI